MMAVHTSPPAINLSALERALGQRLRARRTGERSWEVTSHSEPGRWRHQFVHRDGQVECDCPAGQFRRGCTHAALVTVMVMSTAEPEPRPKHATAMLGHERRTGKYFSTEDDLEF